MKTNALHSLYGGKVARTRAELLLVPGGKALAGNVGGQERRQTVLTPRWFLQQLINCAGEPIGYDPCTTVYNPCKAKVFSTIKENGLNVNWAKQSDKHGWIFVNPPFKYLNVWMSKALMESERGARIYMLAPFRPWRVWFCRDIPFNFESSEVASYGTGLNQRIVQSLAPLAFVGEKSAYPAPLCVIPYNLPLATIVNLKGKNMITGSWDMARLAA